MKRLLRNKSAVAGLVIIVLSIITALLGYLITPDSTPYSNDQVLQINNKEPGFTITMLKKRKNKEVPQRSFVGMMFYGQQNPYELIPINSYTIEGDTLVANEYTGSPGSNEIGKYALVDLVYALNPGEAKVQWNGDQVSLVTESGEQVTTSLASLQNTVTSTQVVPYTYIMGTDRFGRDMFSRLLIGVRTSLAVGFVAVIISMFVGILMGALAGYYSGAVDEAIMWLINVIWSVPTILLVFAITLVWDRGLTQIFVAIGLTMWVDTARVVRGQVMAVKQEQFVEAAQSLGFNDWRTIFIHILPNITGPIIVISAANFATAILIEAGLSFLGLGVESIVPTWGRMLAENYGYIISDSKSYMALMPGFAIMLMVLAFNLIGNGLRDALDIKTSLSGNR